jgi:primosomal protein N' (replication factor Y)
MSSGALPAEQVALLKRQVRSKRPKPGLDPAPQRPVARVALDVALPHLDRPFDYTVPAAVHEQAVPGCRVKVRFAGRDVAGFVVDRVETTSHLGPLASLSRVVSAEPVLTPAVLELARLTADRYAGTVADVLRLAVPPRHARVEAEAARTRQAPVGIPWETLAACWEDETGGPALLRRLADGHAPRAVWTATPQDPWPTQLASAAAATLASGRGTIICVPTARDVAQVDSALVAALGTDSHVVLTADLGPAARYRAFLALVRGDVRIVLGTRSAAFAPVHGLGLVAMWDDGDDLYAEPRAPYPHTRQVLLLRAHHERTGALLAGWTRSVEGQALVESGWAMPMAASRRRVRATSPQVHITGESESDLERDLRANGARVPRRVFEVVRQALEAGPVLVHVPRFGYHPVLSCNGCRRAARCQFCAGPLSRARPAANASCRWCSAPADPWKCLHCDGLVFRFPVVGSLRTAEEWGRSFPLVPVVSSGGDHVVDEVDDSAAIVVATPGAEPRTAGKYAAAVVLDTWLTMSRPELRAGEEALRRWINVASLVRPAPEGGRVVAVGDGGAALQALVRWDPEGFVARELAERRSARFPPSSRLATVVGSPESIPEVVSTLRLPDYVEVLGPAESSDGQQRLVLRTSNDRGAGMTKALQQLQATRSSRKLSAVSVHVDPPDFA